MVECWSIRHGRSCGRLLGCLRLVAQTSGGGWTLPISQRWWGHKAEKLTWLYIVGVGRRDIPNVPLRLGEATHVVCSSRRDGGVRLVKGMPGWRPDMKKPEREATPPELAAWLVELARRTRSNGMEHHAER